MPIYRKDDWAEEAGLARVEQSTEMHERKTIMVENKVETTMKTCENVERSYAVVITAAPKKWRTGNAWVQKR